MANAINLEQTMQSPEHAIANLAELFRRLSQPESPDFERVVESLENCGIPPAASLPLLLEQLETGENEPMYWAGTLLGRWLEANAGASQPDLQEKVTQHLGSSLAAAKSPALERVVLALSYSKPLSSTIRNHLMALREGASPRLERLIETALQ